MELSRVLAGDGRRVRVPHRDLIQYDEDYEGAELEEQAGVPEGDHRPSRSGSSRDGLSELGASTRRAVVFYELGSFGGQCRIRAAGPCA